MFEIKNQLIPIGHPNRKGEKTKPIAVIVHYTANDSPTATDTANVNYIGRKYVVKNGEIYEANGVDKFRFGSAHWFIDINSATLCIPQDEVVWGCGDRALPYDNGYKGQTKIAQDVFNHKQNYLTINYELCNNDTIKNSSADWEQVCNSAIDIIAKDMITYNISTDRIYRHFDISGKLCPKPFVDNEKAWIDYKNKIIKRVNELKGGVSTMTKKVVITTDKLNVRQIPVSGAVLGQYTKDQIVDVYELANGWYRVNINGKNGFISSSYVKDYVETAKPVEPAKEETVSKQLYDTLNAEYNKIKDLCKEQEIKLNSYKTLVKEVELSVLKLKGV